jgi:hypothetical protein
MSDKYGKAPIGGMSSDAQALPDGSSSPATGVSTGIYIPGVSGQIAFGVWANIDFAVDTAKAFSVMLQCSTDNNTWVDVAPSVGHNYPFHKTSDDAAVAISAGDRIAYGVLPDEGFTSYKYWRFAYTTDADLTDYDVDAFFYLNH